MGITPSINASSCTATSIDSLKTKQYDFRADHYSLGDRWEGWPNKVFWLSQSTGAFPSSSIDSFAPSGICSVCHVKRALHHKPWAASLGIASWATFLLFLKWIVSPRPRSTSSSIPVITSGPDHMRTTSSRFWCFFHKKQDFHCKESRLATISDGALRSQDTRRPASLPSAASCPCSYLYR